MCVNGHTEHFIVLKTKIMENPWMDKTDKKTALQYRTVHYINAWAHVIFGCRQNSQVSPTAPGPTANQKTRAWSPEIAPYLPLAGGRAIPAGKWLHLGSPKCNTIEFKIIKIYYLWPKS